MLLEVEFRGQIWARDTHLEDSQMMFKAMGLQDHQGSKYR